MIFSDGTTLNIFNNHHYDGGSAIFVKSKKEKSVEEGASQVVITLDDDSRISIGMSDGDYNGPEAFVLICEGESPVVWN